MTCNFLNTTFDDKIGTYCGKPGVFFNGRKVRCLDCKDAVWPTERYVCRRIMKMGARRNLPCGKMTVFADGFCSHCRRTYPDLVTHEQAPVEHHIIRDRVTGVTRIYKVVEEDFDLTDEKNEPSKVVDLTNEPSKVVDITNDDDDNESSDEPDDSKDEDYVPGEESESESLEVYHDKKKRLGVVLEAVWDVEAAMTDGIKTFVSHHDGEWWVKTTRSNKPAFDACQTLVGEAMLVGGCDEAHLDALVDNASNAAAAAKHKAASAAKKITELNIGEPPMCSICHQKEGRLQSPNPNENRLLCVFCHLDELFKQIRRERTFDLRSQKERNEWDNYVTKNYIYLLL